MQDLSTVHTLEASEQSIIKTSMTKLVLLSIAVAASITSATAQTINFEDLSPTIGSTYTSATSDYMDPGSAGVNQTWDFSGMTAIDQFTTSIVDPTQQPGAESFPNATFANVIEGTGQVGFSRAANNKIEVVGLYAPTGIMTWPDPRTQLEFPMTYQASFSDTYERLAILGPGIENQEIGSTTTLVDGSGTLITPSGTYTNVLRLRIETTADLVTRVNGTVVSTIPFTDVSHVFVKAGFQAPLASFISSDFSGQSTQSAVFYVSSTLGLDAQDLFGEFTLYPVPAKDRLTLSFNLETNATVQFNLFAIDGRLIGQLSKQIFAQGANLVELELPSDVPTGVYMLQLQTDSGSETRKIVVE